jgi:hypothetical protein
MLELYILFFEVTEECMNGMCHTAETGPCSSTRLKLNFAYLPLSFCTPFIPFTTPHITI